MKTCVAIAFRGTPSANQIDWLVSASRDGELFDIVLSLPVDAGELDCGHASVIRHTNWDGDSRTSEHIAHYTNKILIPLYGACRGDLIWNLHDNVVPDGNLYLMMRRALLESPPAHYVTTKHRAAGGGSSGAVVMSGECVLWRADSARRYTLPALDVMHCGEPLREATRRILRDPPRGTVWSEANKPFICLDDSPILI